MKITLNIAKSNILDVFRDLKSNGIIFVLPVVFIFIFGSIFNQVDQTVTEISVGYIETESLSQSNDLQVLKYISSTEDEIELKINLSEYTELEKLEEDVKNAQIAIGVEISDSENTKLIINSNNLDSITARSILIEVFPNSLDGRLTTANVIDTEETSIFQLQAPGLIIYGILIMIPQVAGSLAKLTEKDYLMRLSLSKVKSRHIIGGYTLSNFFIGIIQTILLFTVSSWFGLKLDVFALQSFLFLIPVIFFSIGIGLVIGSLVPRAETGQNTGTILSIILGFLSGSFIVGIENIGFNLGNTFIAITDFVPTHYAYRGMTDLIIYNQGFSSVLGHLAVISLSALAILMIGIISYQKMRLTKNFK